MTTKRHYIDRPTAPPTRGEEEQRAACAGQWHLIDVTAHKPGSRYHEAARYELGLLCAGCPLLTCAERVA